MEFTRQNNVKDGTEKKKELNKAVAVKYNPGMAAPAIVAKGVGSVAERIVEKAKEADVQIYKNKDLVEELSKVDLGTNIPPELYEVVAQILVFVSDLDKLQGYRNAYGKK